MTGPTPRSDERATGREHAGSSGRFPWTCAIALSLLAAACGGQPYPPPGKAVTEAPKATAETPSSSPTENLQPSSSPVSPARPSGGGSGTARDAQPAANGQSRPVANVSGEGRSSWLRPWTWFSNPDAAVPPAEASAAAASGFAQVRRRAEVAAVDATAFRAEAERAARLAEQTAADAAAALAAIEADGGNAERAIEATEETESREQALAYALAATQLAVRAETDAKRAADAALYARQAERQAMGAAKAGAEQAELAAAMVEP